MESTREEVSSGVVRSCPIETGAVRSLFDCLDDPRTVWTAPTTTVVTGGAEATLTATGDDRFAEIQQSATALFDALEIPDSLPAGARPRLFGGFSFTASTETQSTDDQPWTGYASAQFVLPTLQVSVSSDGTWLTSVAVGPDARKRADERVERWARRVDALPEFEGDRRPGVTERRYTPEFEGWRSRIDSVVERIDRGELQKVVLATALQASLQRDPHVIDILTRLGETYPSCYQFLFEPPGGGTFFGATPERLVRVRGTTVDTEALAGSIGRGETGTEDEWLETRLFESEKNNHEHDFVVETIRDQLSGVTDDIETGARTVRKLATVQHLQTPIRATLDEPKHVLNLAKRLHPTPAVGGLPPEEAMQTIRDLEGFDRGWYAAPVGWIDEHGDGTFVVAIRSALARERTVRLFAGAGIVSDSDPHEEWDELDLKFRPILDELTE
jgi:menaquinone-specific isochorismate synthase